MYHPLTSSPSHHCGCHQDVTTPVIEQTTLSALQQDYLPTRYCCQDVATPVTEQGSVTAHAILPITSSTCKSQGLTPELLLDGKTCHLPSDKGCLHHHHLPLRKTHSCSFR